MKAQLFEARDRVGELEHKEFLSSSAKDMQAREIQQLKMQLQ